VKRLLAFAQESVTALELEEQRELSRRVVPFPAVVTVDPRGERG
jgi:hypothetical protein